MKYKSSILKLLFKDKTKQSNRQRAGCGLWGDVCQALFETPATQVRARDRQPQTEGHVRRRPTVMFLPRTCARGACVGAGAGMWVQRQRRQVRGRRWPGPGQWPCFRPVSLEGAGGAARRLRGVLFPEGDRSQPIGPPGGLLPGGKGRREGGPTSPSSSSLCRPCPESLSRGTGEDMATASVTEGVSLE